MDAKQLGRIGCAVLGMTGCATVGTQQMTAAQHETRLSAEGGPTVRQGALLGQGPLTLVRAIYVPAHGVSGKAELWTSRDPACAPAGQAFGRVRATELWDGTQRVSAGEYLCAGHESSDVDAQLTWWTTLP